MTDKPVADCYSASDRKLMVWGQELRRKMLAPLLVLMTKCRLTADILTLASLAAGLAFCPVYFFCPPAALGLLALHVALDGLDGPLARHAGTASRRGSFTDTMTDQIVIAASTITLIAGGVVWVVPGACYIFIYTIVVAFSMIRNAMEIPYAWLVRPRFFVYLWIPIELYVLPGSIDYVLWTFTALLLAKMISGFVKIRKRL
jgi:phosphatidylglycerophosphate synthase